MSREVRRNLGLVAARRRSQRCEVLLVDETSMRKRHRYVTVIVNGDTGHTLAMVEHRSSAGLTGFLMSQPHSWRRSVKVVVSDGSNAYKASIQTCLPQARHVLDRFHIIRWFTAGLTAVRREIQRRNNGTKPVAGPQVFCARFLLLRRGDTLTDTDQARLDQLFDAHPRLKTGWQALQELHGLYLADDHDGALEALDRFGDLYKTGELPEFENIVNTIINWSDEILAWHHTGRPSNGRIEGINNLLQTLRPTAHGFTNPTNYQARGHLIT
ncbi:MAG: ISL3 family transposase [Acidimicrobiaceae bacterium]|nr:ISL3 family transposase [Acidimicrobiaceae bacterium]